ESALQGRHGAAAAAVTQLRLRGGRAGRGSGGQTAGQGVPGLRTDHAVHADAGRGLTVLDGPQGRGAEHAVDLQARAVGVQTLLEVGDGAAAGAEPQLHRGVLSTGGRDGGRGRGDRGGGPGGRRGGGGGGRGRLCGGGGAAGEGGG